MNRTGNKALLTFYYHAILLAKRDTRRRVSLAKLRGLKQKNAEIVTSWMQWADAKRWFTSSLDNGEVIYELKPEHQDTAPADIYEQLKKIYT